MKKILYFIAVNILIINSAFSQIPYYDALILKENLKPSINEDTKDSLVWKDDNSIKILRYYIGPPTDNTHPDVYLRDEVQSNPFFKGIWLDDSDVQSAKVVGQLGDFVSNIGGLDVTNIATGLSRFLIERANQEINILFFDKFKKFLEENEEMNTLFPNSTKFIINTQPYQYAQFMQAFKEAFIRDINDLVNNMEGLLKLDRYINFGVEHPEVYAGILCAVAISKMSNGTHISDIIKGLGEFNNDSISKQQVNLYSSIKLFSILSQSIRSNEEGKGWVSWDDIQTNIINNDATLNIYFGLVYAQIREIKFRGQTGITTIGEILSEPKSNGFDLKKSFDYFRMIEVKISVSNNLFKIIKEKKEKSQNIEYTEYYHYFNSNIDVIEAFLDIDKFIEPFNIGIDRTDFVESKEKYLSLLRTGNDIYRNISEKRYSSALLNFVIIYDELIGQKLGDSWVEYNTIHQSDKKEKKKFLQDNGVNYEGITVNKAFNNYANTSKIGIDKETFLKYGMFMASAAEAENPDDVKNAIRAAALPAGSASIKKNSYFNISLQSYVGGFYNICYSKDLENAWNNKFGITAPLGLSFNWGIKGKRTNSSLGIFTSIIDVGAIVGYELTKDTTNGTITTDAKYKIELGQIFSPGINVVWGFPWKVPFTLGAGAQYGPGIWKFENDNPVIGDPSWRFKIFLAFDIPVFTITNIENKKYKKKK